LVIANILVASVRSGRSQKPSWESADTEPHAQEGDVKLTGSEQNPWARVEQRDRAVSPVYLYAIAERTDTTWTLGVGRKDVAL
jgi:hypothetical protein